MFVCGPNTPRVFFFSPLCINKPLTKSDMHLCMVSVVVCPAPPFRETRAEAPSQYSRRGVPAPSLYSKQPPLGYTLHLFFVAGNSSQAFSTMSLLFNGMVYWKAHLLLEASTTPPQYCHAKRSPCAEIIQNVEPSKALSPHPKTNRCWHSSTSTPPPPKRR